MTPKRPFAGSRARAGSCYLVKKTGKEELAAAVERRPSFELPAGDVLIQVAYSALNYKDALAATGHPGVARSFPHVPGIDVAGTVIESASPEVAPGTQVLVTSYELGVERWAAGPSWCECRQTGSCRCRRECHCRRAWSSERGA